MTAPRPAPSILEASGVDPDRAGDVLGEALAGADDGELFVERSESESFVFDDGRLKSASYDSTEGFGLRVVAGETAGYAHASEISEAAIGRAADVGRPGQARLRRRRRRGARAPPTPSSMARTIPLASPGFSDKVALLQEIDAFARARDPRVAQVMASLAGERRVIEILRADGRLMRDVRPLVRLNVQVTVEKDGRRESGTSGAGGRAGFEAWITPGALAGPGRRGPAPGAGQPRRRRLPGRRDGRGAGPRLERRPAARGGRPRPGGRLQPQGHQRLFRPHRRAGRRARRHRVRRRHDPRPPRLADRRRRRHAHRAHHPDRGRHPGRLHARPP